MKVAVISNSLYAKMNLCMCVYIYIYIFVFILSILDNSNEVLFIKNKRNIELLLRKCLLIISINTDEK